MKRLLALAVAPLALFAFMAPQANAQTVIVRPAPAPVIVPAAAPGFGAFYSTPIGSGRLAIGIGNGYYPAPPIYVAPRVIPAPVYYSPYPYPMPRPYPPHHHHGHGHHHDHGHHHHHHR